MPPESSAPATPGDAVAARRAAAPPVRPEIARAATARAMNTPVDAAEEKRIGEELRDVFTDMIADLVQSAREEVQQFADFLLPKIARQSILARSDDPAVRARAQGHLEHLRAQAITNAAAHGVALQQRNEQRLIGIVDTLVMVASRLI